MEAACYEGCDRFIVLSHGLYGVLHHGVVTALGYVVEAYRLFHVGEDNLEVVTVIARSRRRRSNPIEIASDTLCPRNDGQRHIVLLVHPPYEVAEQGSVEVAFLTYDEVVISVCKGGGEELLKGSCHLCEVIEGSFFVVSEDLVSYVVFEAFYFLEEL